jgi:hypothetical protein
MRAAHNKRPGAPASARARTTEDYPMATHERNTTTPSAPARFEDEEAAA